MQIPFIAALSMIRALIPPPPSLKNCLIRTNLVHKKNAENWYPITCIKVLLMESSRGICKWNSISPKLKRPALLWFVCSYGRSHKISIPAHISVHTHTHNTIVTATTSQTILARRCIWWQGFAVASIVWCIYITKQIDQIRLYIEVSRVQHTIQLTDTL